MASSVASSVALEPCHYRVLGLPHDFDGGELKRAYRAASLKHHPDKATKLGVGSSEAFARVQEAHAVLSDPTRKQDFDLGTQLFASYANPIEMSEGRVSLTRHPH